MFIKETITQIKTSNYQVNASEKSIRNYVPPSINVLLAKEIIQFGGGPTFDHTDEGHS